MIHRFNFGLYGISLRGVKGRVTVRKFDCRMPRWRIWRARDRYYARTGYKRRSTINIWKDADLGCRFDGGWRKPTLSIKRISLYDASTKSPNPWDVNSHSITVITTSKHCKHQYTTIKRERKGVKREGNVSYSEKQCRGVRWYPCSSDKIIIHFETSNSHESTTIQS